VGWPEILRILEAELDNFEDRPERLKWLKDWKDENKYPSRKAAIDAMKSDESNNRRILDQACLQFASKRTWPDINHEQKYWLYARLSAARDLVSFVLRSKRSKGWVFPDYDKDVSIESILEHVLVTYWHFLGRCEFLGSLIFSPMGPFDARADIPEADIS
jgi:hypothetical protein